MIQHKQYPIPWKQEKLLSFQWISFFSIELSTRFEFTQESSSSAKQEVDQLREEVKVLSAQLVRQHNASLDSQVWLQTDLVFFFYFWKIEWLLGRLSRAFPIFSQPVSIKRTGTFFHNIERECGYACITEYIQQRENIPQLEMPFASYPD